MTRKKLKISSYLFKKFGKLLDEEAKEKKGKAKMSKQTKKKSKVSDESSIGQSTDPVKSSQLARDFDVEEDESDKVPGDLAKWAEQEVLMQKILSENSTLKEELRLRESRKRPAAALVVEKQEWLTDLRDSKNVKMFQEFCLKTLKLTQESLAEEVESYISTKIIDFLPEYLRAVGFMDMFALDANMWKQLPAEQFLDFLVHHSGKVHLSYDPQSKPLDEQFRQAFGRDASSKLSLTYSGDGHNHVLTFWVRAMEMVSAEEKRLNREIDHKACIAVLLDLIKQSDTPIALKYNQEFRNIYKNNVDMSIREFLNIFAEQVRIDFGPGVLGRYLELTGKPATQSKSHSSNSTNSAHKPSARPHAENSSQKFDKKACYGCGRRGKHKQADCKIGVVNKRNPKLFSDYNRENCEFTKSVSGLKLLAQNPPLYCLQRGITADGHRRSQQELDEWDKMFPKVTGDKKCKHNFIAICDECHDTHDERVSGPTYNMYIIIKNNTNIPVTCLLDTGADSGNYLSAHMAARLGSFDITPQSIPPKYVCGSIANNMSNNHCKIIDQAVELNIECCDSNGNLVKFPLTATVLTTSKQYIDLVIGYPTLLQYKLLGKLLPELVFDECLLKGSTESRNLPDLHTLGSKVQTDSNLGIETGTRHVVGPQLVNASDSKQGQQFSQNVTTLAVLHTQSGIPYPDEEVAFREPHSPWESVETLESKGNDIMKLLQARIYGPPSLKKALISLCQEYIDIFDTSVRSEPALIPPMELEVDVQRWRTKQHTGPPRRQSEVLDAETRRQVDKMLELGVIRRSQQPWYSQILLVNKPGPPPPAPQKKRFCIDYRKLNDLTKSMGWPIPHIGQLLDRLGNAKASYYSIFDMTSGYHQAPLSESSIAFTAFVTFMGVYEWLRVPMGLKGAPSYFQQMMASVVLAGLLYFICELYISMIY